MVDIALACVDARIGALLSGANDDERRWTVSANERTIEMSQCSQWLDMHSGIECRLLQPKLRHVVHRAADLCQRAEVFMLALVAAIASFLLTQQRLLLSGDVEMNPGPLGQHTKDPLDCQCSHVHIYNIATLSFNLKALAKRLIGPQLAQEIIGQKEISEQEKRDEVFEKWLEVKGPNATYKEVVSQFEALQCTEAAAAVRLLVSSNAQSTANDPTLTFKNIVTALKTVVDWKTLSVQFDISAAKIKEIDVNNRGQVANCKHDMVQFWLESDTSCSWKKLIDALISSDQSVLAGEIRSTYCPQNIGDAEMNPGLSGPLTTGVPQKAQTDSSSAASSPSEIVADDIILNEMDLIGEGAQGCVYKAFWISKQKPIAVKKIGFLSNAAKREIETLKSVRHKNIVTFYGVYEITYQRHCLVLELADESLDQHLKKSAPNLEQSLNWAQQVGQGMHYLHFDAPDAIIHGDLKSSNVLVYSGGVIKIGDFGSSKFKVGQQSSVTRVTMGWKAPELFDSGKNSTESDVYAFGILLWEIVTHEVPYKELTDVQIMFRVTKDQRPDIPSSCNEALRELIQECWDSEPKNRPTFQTVLIRIEAAKGTERGVKIKNPLEISGKAINGGASLMRGQGEEHRNLYDEQDEYEEDQGDYDPYDDEQDEDQEDQRDYDPFDDEQDEDQEDQRDYDPYDDEQDNYDED